MIYDPKSLTNVIKNMKSTVNFYFKKNLVLPEGERICLVCKNKVIFNRKLARWFCNQCRRENKPYRSEFFNELHMCHNKGINFAPKLLKIIYCFAKLENPRKAAATSQCSSQTVREMFTKIRTVISWHMQKKICDQKLGKGGEVIEIDESAFNRKRKHNRGKHYKTCWVLGAVERRTGKVRLEYVADRTEATLRDFVKRRITEGARAYSDAWKGYYFLAKENFRHVIVNHEKKLVDPNTGANSNTIEGAWKWAKKFLKVYGTNLGKANKQLYLDEHMFRLETTKKVHEQKKIGVIMEKIIEILGDWNVMMQKELVKGKIEVTKK